MQKRKIKYWEARVISEAVAKKAFEHLTNPFEIELSKIAREIYGDINSTVNLNYLEKLGYAIPKERLIVHVKHLKSEDEQVVMAEGNFLVPSTYGEQINFIDDNLWEQAAKVHERLDPLVVKRNGLQESIQVRLSDKLTTTVTKAWPELIPFINDYYGDSNDDTLIVPFENLLRQFLPMLPAPKENENESATHS